MAGEENRHRLIAHLKVSHPPAVAFHILSQQEHGKEIAPVFAGSSPLLDDPIDHGVEPAQRGLEIVPVGLREDGALELIEDLAERIADFLGVGFDIGAEKGAGDDHHRQPVHLPADIEHDVRLPSFAQARCVRDHLVGIRRDPFPMKRRLRKTPLAKVELAFADE